ncbi:MAG: YchF/TatD family DNA exonuclease [Actinobacteria bacterium]|nr:YchF/TatD family DNA exonuclease [Actinomycetota bacterium]
MKDADGTRQKLSYPDLPEPLLVGTYDNHTHLEIADGDQPMNYQDHLALANQVGILGAVQVGVTLESSRWSAEVAATEPRLLAAVAIHPNEAARYESMQALDVDIDGIADLASQERVRAIGETGLDFFRTESDQGKSFQQHSFERHIQIAKDFGLALQIHDRDAHEQVVETLQRVGAPEKVVFHCYSGDIQLAKICAEQGWYTSFAGNITIKRNQHLRDSFRHMPKDLILVETDAPFLTPEPLRGRPNAPYLVPITVRFMAAELGMDVNELSGQLAKNTVAVYGSWGR